jgi:hypothetical protein
MECDGFVQCALVSLCSCRQQLVGADWVQIGIQGDVSFSSLDQC